MGFNGPWVQTCDMDRFMDERIAVLVLGVQEIEHIAL